MYTIVLMFSLLPYFVQLHSSSLDQDLETVLSKTKPVACMMIPQKIHVPHFATKRMDMIKWIRIIHTLIPLLQKELELKIVQIHPGLMKPLYHSTGRKIKNSGNIQH